MAPEQGLARFVTTTSFPDLPPDVVEAARNMVFWTLGTAVAGTRSAGSREIADFALGQGGGGSTMLGFGGSVSSTGAGFANGSFAKALEYEDKLWVDGTHGFCVSGAVVPAALATAEEVGGISGEAFLTAVAVAAEVQCRMVLAVEDAIETHGWNPSYLYSSLGAAVAAARVRGLSASQVGNALGLAYVQTTGNRQATLEAVHGVRMQMGFGVRNGIAAADLAGRGLTGPLQSLTGELGLYNLFWTDNRVVTDTLTEGLGSDWKLLRIGFKAHPCGAVAHPALDALDQLRDDHPIDWADIERIDISGTRRLWVMVEAGEHRGVPRNVVELQFSLPWAFACKAVEGPLRFEHFTASAYEDQRFHRTAAKVHAKADSPDGASRVSVRLSSGERLTSEPVTVPLGHPDNPLPRARIREVFQDCLTFGLGEGAAGKAREAAGALDRVEQLDDATRLAPLLTAEP